MVRYIYDDHDPNKIVFTFILLCIICCAVCVALSVAIAAGIAYGYNYSMAEFLTFSRQDTSVYLKRGQFRERLSISEMFRRSGDASDAFGSNSTMDYEDRSALTRSDNKPLSDTWLKAQDTKTYAERLAKFSQARQNENDMPMPYPGAITDEAAKTRTLLPLSEQALNAREVLGTDPYAIVRGKPPLGDAQVMRTMPGNPRVLDRGQAAVDPDRLIDVTVKPIVPTRTYASKPDNIFMRKFNPITPMPDYPAEKTQPADAMFKEEDFYNDERSINPTETMGGGKKPYVPMRHWGRMDKTQGFTPEVDEDNIVYRPS